MSKGIKSYDFVILGAGPSGLAFGRTLLDSGIKSFIILEKEKQAGGLCRSEVVDGSPLDVGGGHVLDVTRKKVLDFLFRFLPKNRWNRHKRCSKIQIHGHLIDFPIESNVWQLPTNLQVKYLMSLFKASSFSGRKTLLKRFDKWVYHKYGTEIAVNYMIPYNKKLWGDHFSRLNTSWLYKLPSVSFEEVLFSCLNKSPQGRLPAHANFYYPKEGGFGLLWNNIAKSLRSHVLLDNPVKSFDYENRIVNNKYKGVCVINTIPWPVLAPVSNFPIKINRIINRLRFVPLQLDYYKENIDSPAHWTYVPDEKVLYHRIIHRNNIVPKSRGHWTESNAKRVGKPQSKIFSVSNEYAYPVNDFNKNEIISSVLNWNKENNIYGIGRWGKWEHMNADAAVEDAINFSQSLIKK